MQETWVQSLGQEDPLEKGMAIHSNILARGIPWTEVEKESDMTKQAHNKLHNNRQISAFFIPSHPSS